MKGRIYLIGYMGTGKSTIGRALAKRLKAKLVDMDVMIEKEQGKAISQIFAESGEEAFRDMETDLLRRLSQEKEIIVSCGGGVPLRPENAELMKATGTVIWLDATPETIYTRIKNSKTRPLLANNMTLAHISAMMTSREPVYERAATHRISVDKGTVEELVSKIIEIM